VDPSQLLPSSADPQLRAWLRRRLLAWFRTHQRPLPWRATRDPYAIWVSEVMLQQTLVATVVPYFERFLQCFPDLVALARAEEQEVLRLWEGLGYYSRARNLHRSAQFLAEAHNGQLPDDPDVLRKLPGFGRYTVGAVLSQAFDRRLPILEANSLRVLCRFFALPGDPRTAPLHERLWSIAAALLPRRASGEFNQALMELGALICTPAAPQCARCPLQKRCGAYRTNQQETLPFRPPPPAPVLQREAAVVVRQDNRVLLVQRPPSGRWAGLWEFPHAPCLDAETPEAAAQRWLTQLTGIEASIGPELTTITHGVTRYRITVVCLEAIYQGGDFRSDFYQASAWVELNTLSDYPLSSPQRQIARALGRPRQGMLW
jgi:A/G-specific adenine glycosylase